MAVTKTLTLPEAAEMIMLVNVDEEKRLTAQVYSLNLKWWGADACLRLGAPILPFRSVDSSVEEE